MNNQRRGVFGAGNKRAWGDGRRFVRNSRGWRSRSRSSCWPRPGSPPLREGTANPSHQSFLAAHRRRSDFTDDNDDGASNGIERTNPILRGTLEVSGRDGASRLYFDEGLSESHPATKLVVVFEAYFRSRFAASILEISKQETKVSFPVDVEQMFAVNDIRGEIPDFAEKLTNSPDVVIKAMGLAMYHILCSRQDEMDVQFGEDNENDEPVTSENCVWLESTSPVAIQARLYSLKPLTPLKDIRANHLGKLVSIRGTVVRMSSVQPRCVRLTFRCTNCHTLQHVKLPDGKYAVPTRCVARECVGRIFFPERSSEIIEAVNRQSIKLQEQSDDRDEARVPRSIECELTSDLVQSCSPGDVVTLVGILKVNSSSSMDGRRCRDDDCMFSMYVEANSVINESLASDSSGVESLSTAVAFPVGVEFSQRDLIFVRELFFEPDRFRVLVHSLCPSIYGHEAVKAGLLLALFGGTRRRGASRNDVPVRSNVHILVVGDPGLGKSQMLRACSTLSPRGVYVCGRNATVAGLTVSVSNRDGGSGCETLEAGALVLSDGGCCCIDELDKMGGRQQQALLEAMEQQNVSVAKSGVLCNLTTRCSVLAAANPIAGHYDRGKTVAENLRGAFGSTSALLSRFDLVFVLVDRPDREVDAKLSEHIIAQRFSVAVSKTSASRSSSSAASHSSASSVLGVQKSVTSSDVHNMFHSVTLISERMKVKDGETPIDVIPHCLLRKYIAYARTYIHPKLSREASDVLRGFYIQLRKSGRSETGTPVTLRQLESLVRLSEARARLDLREEVTEADANDVIDIMRYSMIDTLSDELGIVHLDRSQHGSGLSRQSKAKRFVASLNVESKRIQRTTFSLQEMRDIAKDIGVNVTDFDGFLESLNYQGYLLHKGLKHYQLNCV